MERHLSDSLLWRVSEILAHRTGLNFPKQRWGDLERGLIGVAKDRTFGGDLKSVVDALLSGPLSRGHIEFLASNLTVGETYFFRDRPVFDFLEHCIIPLIISRKPEHERRIRIWSAGCCTGEEAYSLAICLDRCQLTLQGWDTLLLGTDINPHFLSKAAAGDYSAWSFRGAPQQVRDRYFRKRPDNRLAISPNLRRRVRLSYLNLAEDSYPSLLNDTMAMDVIFCRNVLMYFTQSQAAQVVKRLHASLVEGGWLVLGATDVPPALMADFERVEFQGGACYRKMKSRGCTGHDTASHQPKLVEFETVHSYPSPTALETGNAPGNAKQYEVLASTCNDGNERQSTKVYISNDNIEGSVEVDLESSASASTSDFPLLARTSANEGRLAEAVKWCERAISADTLNPNLHFLLATIQREKGNNDAAIESLRRTLYIAPDFVLAHFALGNVQLSLHHYREAGRCFRRTRALLESFSPNETLPESDGLTARRLLEIVEAAEATIPRAAASVR